LRAGESPARRQQCSGPRCCLQCLLPRRAVCPPSCLTIAVGLCAVSCRASHRLRGFQCGPRPAIGARRAASASGVAAHYRRSPEFPALLWTVGDACHVARVRFAAYSPVRCSPQGAVLRMRPPCAPLRRGKRRLLCPQGEELRGTAAALTGRNTT